MRPSLANNRRTDPKIEQKIVKLIASGYRYSDISDKTNVPISTIKKIKKRNNIVLLRMKQYIIRSDANIVARIRQKALRVLEIKLDNATSDDKLGTKELLSIVKEMAAQSQLSRLDAVPINPVDEHLRQEDIIRAMESGDDEALTRAVFNTTK